jgi:MFS family permease
LLGSAAGSLITGPFSETFGRNPVYIGTMFFFMIFTMASGLSPNIGAQITFRFFAGIFGCAPLTCAGGTISDLWNGLEKIYGFPLFAIPAFGGAMLGPVIGSYIGTGNLPSWRWTEWITLIMAGLVTINLVISLPETHPSTLQSWKARQLRRLLDDDRYQSKAEVVQMTFWKRMKVALTRPFLLCGEAIVICVTIYLTVVWAVLFTFLDGYTYIFANVYHTSQGLTSVIFAAMYVGVLLASPLVPLVYEWTKKDMEKEKGKGLFSIRPETRLWFAMVGGAWAIPTSLFWLAWTDYVRMCTLFLLGSFANSIQFRLPSASGHRLSLLPCSDSA